MKEKSSDEISVTESKILYAGILLQGLSVTKQDGAEFLSGKCVSFATDDETFIVRIKRVGRIDAERIFFTGEVVRSEGTAIVPSGSLNELLEAAVFLVMKPVSGFVNILENSGMIAVEKL